MQKSEKLKITGILFSVVLFVFFIFFISEASFGGFFNTQSPHHSEWFEPGEFEIATAIYEVEEAQNKWGELHVGHLLMARALMVDRIEGRPDCTGQREGLFWLEEDGSDYLESDDFLICLEGEWVSLIMKYPYVINNGVDEVGLHEATLRGELENTGNALTVEVWFEWGEDEHNLNNKTERITLTSLQEFEAHIDELDEGTTYYFRPRAENYEHESYEEQVGSFRTVDTFDLTMNASPLPGGAATDQTNNSPYTGGTVVDISAQPQDGYEFAGWSAPAGNFGNENNPDTTFTMPDQDVTVTANFADEPAPDGCSATTRSWGNCSGSISSADDGQTRTATDSSGDWQGQATYRCDDGSWTEISATCEEEDEPEPEPEPDPEPEDDECTADGDCMHIDCCDAVDCCRICDDGQCRCIIDSQICGPGIF